jgi:putative membrane protein
MLVLAYQIAKIVHLLFVISWFACLFYLPRILVNIAETIEAKESEETRSRLFLMGKRLLRFGHLMMGLALLSGVVIWYGFSITGGWLHIKLTLVVFLVGYQIITGRFLKRFIADKIVMSSKSLRWFNEIPVLFLLCILFLVVLKPL